MNKLRKSYRKNTKRILRKSWKRKKKADENYQHIKVKEET